jgi:phospholipid transport system substrate-binding protein
VAAHARLTRLKTPCTYAGPLPLAYKHQPQDEGQLLAARAITLPKSRPISKPPLPNQCSRLRMLNVAEYGENLTARGDKFAPRGFTLGLRPSPVSLLAIVLVLLLGLTPLRAQTPSAAVTKIQSYYQQLMPTIQQAARLSVRERDKRFSPVFTAVFDIPTMTRLAVGPAWKSFSAEQQAAARDAFAGFIVAEYASQIKDYSGESFVVDPQTTPESRGGGEIVKTKLLQPGGRVVNINYLVRRERVVDIYLNGTISDLAMRRDEFASVIAAGGADALIKRLQDRRENLLAK